VHTNTELTPHRDDYRIAYFAALAIVIHVLESALPSPVPGVKPGFANIITIIVLCRYGWRLAAWVSLLRVVAGSMVLGTFLSPTFLMSLTGATVSITVLGLMYRMPGARFSAVGYSLLAAMGHISGQFLMAYTLLIPHPGLWRLYPVLMTAAVILGLINGIISSRIVQRMQVART
jgi:heptaprenyl diphosphate synthase